MCSYTSCSPSCEETKAVAQAQTSRANAKDPLQSRYGLGGNAEGPPFVPAELEESTVTMQGGALTKKHKEHVWRSGPYSERLLWRKRGLLSLHVTSSRDGPCTATDVPV